MDETIQKDLENRFTYHPPKPGQPEIYETIRCHGKALAEVVVNFTPKSREQSLALTKIEEAIMWANAGLARNA